MEQNADWLARGGAYYILAVVSVTSAAYFYFLGAKLGHQTGHPNDGCLYGLCNIVLALFGGGFGFLVLIHNYPYFIVSSCICAVAFPTFGTLYSVRSSRRK